MAEPLYRGRAGDVAAYICGPRMVGDEQVELWPAGSRPVCPHIVTGDEGTSFCDLSAPPVPVNEGRAAQAIRDALAKCVREDGKGFKPIVGQLGMAFRTHWADEGPSNLDCVAAYITQAVLALLSGQTTGGPDAEQM